MTTNSNSKRLLISSVAAAVIGLASAQATAQPQISPEQTAREINAANRLLRDGKVDEALEAFHHIVPAEQQRDELNYNIAVAEYRKGNIDAAESLFSEVAGTSGAAISANSRYNLGNCQYAKAIQMAEQDKSAAIEHLRNAISHYRGALRGDSNNPDARANIELAGALIRKLQQEQQQEDPQQQEQRQQDKEEETKNNQDQEQKEQSERTDDSQSENEPQKSDSKDSGSDPQKNDPQENDQQKNEDEKDGSGASASDESKNEEQKKDAEQNEAAGNASQRPDEHKSRGEDSESPRQKPSDQQAQSDSSDSKKSPSQKIQQESGDQQPADDEGKSEEQGAKSPPVPEGELKAAGQQDGNKTPAGAGEVADRNSLDGLMTREEALKMLQSVRDRDMLRRMQQQRQDRSRRVRVERDW